MNPDLPKPSSPPYESYEPRASACYRFLAREFHAPLTFTGPRGEEYLQSFIHRVIYRTGASRHAPCVALYLLHRLKLKVPAWTIIGSGAPLFVAALVVADKVTSDGSFSLKQWQEVTKMRMKWIGDCERELLRHLEYNVHVSATELEDFEQFKRDINWPDLPSVERCATQPPVYAAPAEHADPLPIRSSSEHHPNNHTAYPALTGAPPPYELRRAQTYPVPAIVSASGNDPTYAQLQGTYTRSPQLISSGAATETSFDYDPDENEEELIVGPWTEQRSMPDTNGFTYSSTDILRW